MTTVPRRVGHRVACGLAAIITAVSTVLAGESSAGAVVDAHPRQVTRHAVTARNIRHERLIWNIGNAREARKPSKAAQPWTIAVPAIRVAAGLMTLGVPSGPAGADDLSLPVPPLAKAAIDAGWYQFTSVPGAAGNAVIVGHVDTYVGPAVFYNLYQLRPGDSVYVDTDGTRQRFDVTSVRELPKPSFPMNQVFGSTDRHVLWLITCGGEFDYQTGHYLDNIVASATWVPPTGNT